MEPKTPQNSQHPTNPGKFDHQARQPGPPQPKAPKPHIVNSINFTPRQNPAITLRCIEAPDFECKKGPQHPQTLPWDPIAYSVQGPYSEGITT